MQLAFRKMQGTGNRILVIDQRDNAAITPSPDRLVAIRAAVPDFDQLMWLGPAESDAATASYRVFNNDGSEVEQCGNGVRCLAVLLADTQHRESSIVFDSPAGPIEARLVGRGRASVNMGTPKFDDALRNIDVNGESLPVTIVSMGNRHCVLDVDDVATADVERLGPAIESHERFPGRINVGFLHVRDRSNVDLRVFERGVGETLACGTGACAAVAAGHRRGDLGDEVRVRLPGGQLVVSWRGGSEAIWLTGDAELISEGNIDL